MRELIGKAFVVFLSLHFAACGAFEPLVIDEHRAPSKRMDDDKGVRSSLEKTAKSLLGIPYRYGGNDRTGFDCSGLTVYTFYQNGITIPRTAANQYQQGRGVGELAEAKQGDLAFFQLNGKIDHVGLITRATKRELWVIHSTSSRGVMHQDIMASSYWKPRLKGVRDLLGD
ncbi:MAG: C40 family peptidase [Saprospiraceae bacterium]|nr:C40 family peptidase [Saprospiraceae bacterium]